VNVIQLHHESIIFDGHCDTLLSLLNGKRKLADRSSEGHIDLPRLREGGVTAQVFAIFIEDQYLPAAAARQTLRLLDVLYRELAENTDSLVLATTASDIKVAKRTNKVAVVVGIEGAESLEEDLALLRVFHRMGLRVLTLAWSRRNQAADGTHEVRTGGGLSRFGLELVQECNRLGIVIDISHLAPAGVKDALEASSQPVIASHSNAHALCSHVRNLTDQQLAAVAANGGVVGVTFVPEFLADGGQGANLDTLLDHIAHIVQIAGIDHVGLGSDFDGFTSAPPTGLEDVARLPTLSKALVRQGYADDHVRKILGGNFMRIFKHVAG